MENIDSNSVSNRDSAEKLNLWKIGLLAIGTLVLSLLLVGATFFFKPYGHKSEVVQFTESQLAPALRSLDVDQLNAISSSGVDLGGQHKDVIEKSKDFGALQSLEVVNVRFRLNELPGTQMASVLAKAHFENRTANLDIVLTRRGAEWKLFLLSVGMQPVIP